MSPTTARAGLLSALTLALFTAAAPRARADSAGMTCGQPTRDGTVTLVVGVTVDDDERPYLPGIRVSATITKDMTPEEKAQKIVDSLYPDPHPWITLQARGAKVVATAKNGYQVEGIGVRTDTTGEWILAESDGVGAASMDGLCSLSETASGFDASGLPASVSLVVGAAIAHVPTFPGQPAEAIEDELMAQLAGQGVATHLATPGDGLAGSYGEDFAGDGRVIVIENVALGAIELDVTDVELTVDLAAVIDRPGGSPWIGTPYCDPEPNSTGHAGAILATGSAFVADEDLTLHAVQLPPKKFGYFLVAANEGFVANPGGSQGNLCLSGEIGRFKAQVQNSGSTGIFSIDVDITALPLSPPKPILPGETWRFQCWFRDIDPTPTSNFTDGVWIEWQ